jgi:hypothetical protein
MTKSEKIREYFRKHPDADVAKVAEKFEAPKGMTYKLRKQVLDGDVSGRLPWCRCLSQRQAAKLLSASAQLAIAAKLGLSRSRTLSRVALKGAS